MNIFDLAGAPRPRRPPPSAPGRPAAPTPSGNCCGTTRKSTLRSAARSGWPCREHRDWLEDYLQTRGLWKDTVPLADAFTDGTGGPADDAIQNTAESGIVPGKAS